MKKINIFKTLILLIGVLLLNSCSEETYPETRLFRPVLNNSSGELQAQDNTIIIDMGKLKSAVSYKIEVSRDTFKTVLGSLNSTSNKIIITDLLWNTLYQVRAIAVAEKEEFNSGVSDFGGVKTDPFPSILNSPKTDGSDVIDVAALVSWAVVAGGQDVTSVKVFAANDEKLTTPLASYDTTPDEILAGEKIINGLTPGTKYQLAIYNGTTIKGWDLYTTKPAIPVDANTIDLRGIVPTSTLLFETLTTAPAGSTILLDGNATYDLNSTYSFNKSLTVKSGYSLKQAGAILNLNSNFSVLAGSNVDSIVFDGVTLTSPDVAAAGKYVFNVNQSSTIGEISFNNCRMSNFRGVCRFQASTGTIGKFTINNCIINNIGGYGVFNVDVATWTAGDVVLKSSTIYRTSVFLASKSTSKTNSITIEDCTLNEFVLKAGTMFKWVSDVTNGIIMKNTVVGHAYDTAVGGTEYAIIGYSGFTAATNWTISNTFATSDFKYTATGAQIPSFPNSTYPKKVEDLWKSPTTGDFNFIDSSFQGIKTSGDPRWRKQ